MDWNDLSENARGVMRDLAMTTVVIAIVSACVLLGLEMHDA